MYSDNEHDSKTELGTMSLQSIPNSISDAELLSRTGNFGSDNHLELTSFDPQSQSCQKQDEISLNNVNQNENTGTLTLDTSHYYDNLTSAPVMIYQMPCGNIVPFDSIVSIPVAKSGQPRANDHDSLLQNSFNSQEIFSNSQNNFTNSQSWYIVNESPRFKGQMNDKMVVSQIYSPEEAANIFLDTHSFVEKNDKCKIDIPDTVEPNEHISSELTVNADGGFNTNEPIDPLALSVYNSTDTDSEVALTLASLGNLKDDNMQPNSSQNLSLDTCFSSQKCSVEEKLNDQDEHHQNSVEVGQSEINLMSNCNVDSQKTFKKPKVNYSSRSESSCKRSRSKVKIKNSTDQQKKPPEAKEHQDPCKNNLLGQLLKASKHCEPASLIPEGVVGDVIPAVGYRIMEMSNLCEMIQMMHKCSNKSCKGLIVMQEQASLREGAVSQLSIICTGCKEGAVCATSSKFHDNSQFDINARVETLKKEFNIDETQVQKMLEILGIFYRLKKDEPQVKFECDYCHKLYTDKSTLYAHIKSIHLEEYRTECEVCFKRFYHKPHYQAHMRKHTKEKPFACDLCPKKFSHQQSLKKHMLSHKCEKKYKCRLCGKFFKLLISIRQHLMQQHKLKKSDTEAQVVTDVIAEVLPSDEESYQQTSSNESRIHDPNNGEASTLVSRNKYTSLHKSKPYTSDVDSMESLSCSPANDEAFITKNCPTVVENIVTPSVASDTVSAVYNPSVKENFSRNFNNWKTPS
ncbi:Zinc finger and SCAN domain-containing protein 5B [Armadillidium nasatum]|uniref:Zinc finger and SCAN domain-containing protein 5B n=1 Tax=Armadillidium nasatum TaxID=96803 RepID=A0A5N5T8Y8_9CRUS|nr:Zinc finger and SCAN domain-containing protein 5B [Armadillidium nasatum]